HPGGDARAVPVAQMGRDELDGAAGADDLDVDGELSGVDDAEDVEGRPGDEFVTGQTALDLGEHEPRGRGEVLLSRLPGSLTVQSRDQTVLGQSHIVGVGAGSPVVAEVVVGSVRHGTSLSTPLTRPG